MLYVSESPSERYNELQKDLQEIEKQKNIDVTKQIIERENREKENIGSQIKNVNPNTTSSLMNIPAFPDTGKINPAVSPTVLPNPQDRELAMRKSGLASLV